VNVRVIMDQAHKSYDSAAYSALTAAGAGVVWSSTSFTYTHQKTITADSGVVSGLESTFNGDFTGSAAGKVAIISPGSMTTAAGTAVNYQVQAIDTATGSLSYSASGLPTGLSISSSTGVISGTASTAGTYSVTLTGKDSSGPSGSASFTWTVGSASGGGRNTVTVTGPGSRSAAVGTQGAVTDATVRSEEWL
jgi:hypothetical protein